MVCGSSPVQSNKKDWEHAKSNATSFLTGLLQSIGQKENIYFDDAKNYLGRINRDIRFSIDKRPYNDYITAMIFREGRKETTPFYKRIQPGNSLIGTGVKSPDGTALRKIRNEIAESGEELKNILAGNELKQAFGALQGETLKRLPQGFGPDHPHLILLLHKEYLLTRSVPDAIVFSTSFISLIEEAFHAALPFMLFMDRAMQE